MFVEMLQMGGPMLMVALVAGGLGGLLAIVVALGIGFARWRVPMSIGWIGLTTAVVAGSIGSFLAQGAYSNAVALASPDMKQTLVASAISTSAYTPLGTLIIVSLSFLLFTLAASVPTAIAVGKDPRFDVRGLLTGLGSALVCTVLAIILIVALLGVGAFFSQGPVMVALPFLALVTTGASLVAAMRISETDRTQQGRVAASRAAVALGGFLTVGLAGYLFELLGFIEAFKAVAVASADQKQAMFAAGLEAASWASTSGWILALIPLGTGVASLLHILGRVEGRQWAGVGVACVQLIILLGGVVYMRSAVIGMVMGLWGA